MTDRNVRVEPVPGVPVEDQRVEVVERKGLGHPDSICDGIAEAVSRALAREYLDRFGRVLHYNTDETQLAAGAAAPAFGGGEVLEPIYILIIGRATERYEGESIPTESIALRTARNYLDEQFPALDVESDVIVDVRLGEGSGDLQEVFDDDDARRVPMANDTSYGVGYAPLSETERLVYGTERRLNREYAADHPEIGPDVKVMGKREDDRVELTVAAAVVDAHVGHFGEYEAAVRGVREYVHDLADELLGEDRDVRVHVNTADDYDGDAIYLTTTGLSAEQGDDGSVGRGNRANGLITPNRSMSMEAVCGKNPVNHIGKIYNLLANEAADRAYREIAGVEEVRVRLLSQIGRPIDEPHVADAAVATADDVEVSDVRDEVTAIIDEELADVRSITDRVIEDEIDVF